MNPDKTNLDDVLDKFNIFGRYHFVFMCYAMFAYAVNGICTFPYIFVAKKSGYTCTDEGFRNNSCGNEDGKRCSNWIYDDPYSFVAEVKNIYKEVYALHSKDDIKDKPSNSLENIILNLRYIAQWSISVQLLAILQCYPEDNLRKLNVAGKFQLACQEWKRTLLGTAHVFGYMIGLFMVGPLSDRLGRKKTIIITGLIGATVGLIKMIVKSYWIYIALEILNEMIGDIYSPLFVLNMEIVSAKNRVVFYAICALGSTIGGSMTALAAWAIPYWRYLLLAVHMPGFLLLAFIITFDESPRWLLTRGKKTETIALLLKMGEKSKVHLDKNALDKLQAEQEIKRTTLINLFKITLKSKTLLKRFLVCIVWWTTSCFVNYGTMINSVSLQGNMYVNYLLLELVHLPSNFITWYLLKHYKRRIPLMCTFFAAGVLFLVHPFLPDYLPWISLSVYLISKLMQLLYLSMTYIYTSELFPTYTRNSMHAMCSAIGRLGGMIAPQTPLLTVYWTHFPTFIFSGLSLLAGLVTFLVPDTTDCALPDTVQEAEDIGVKNKENKRSVTGIDNLAMTETN